MRVLIAVYFLSCLTVFSVLPWKLPVPGPLSPLSLNLLGHVVVPYLTNMSSACFSIAEKKSWNEKTVQIIFRNFFKEMLKSMEYVWVLQLQKY